MTYDIYCIKDGEYTLEKSYTERDKAEKTFDKIKNKKKLQYKMCAVPEIAVGLKLYRQGNYYGTITKETDSFWYVRNEEKELTGDSLKDYNEFLKETFELKFIKDVFDPVEEGLENINLEGEDDID
jgi:Zn-dependent peptidase ImmA (M78 family)